MVNWGPPGLKNKFRRVSEFVHESSTVYKNRKIDFNRPTPLKASQSQPVLPSASELDSGGQVVRSRPTLPLRTEICSDGIVMLHKQINKNRELPWDDHKIVVQSRNEQSNKRATRAIEYNVQGANL